MENNMVTKGNVEITRNEDSFGNKLTRIVNHPATKGAAKVLGVGATLYTGYRISDNVIKHHYNGSIDLLGLVKITLSPHDKS